MRLTVVLAAFLGVLILGIVKPSVARSACALERLSQPEGGARARLNRILLGAALEKLPQVNRCDAGFSAALLPKPGAPVSLVNEAYREAVAASLYGAAGLLKLAGKDDAARATLVRLGTLMRTYALSRDAEVRRDSLLDILVVAKALAGLGARAEADALIDYAEKIVRASTGANNRSIALSFIAQLRVSAGNTAAACALLASSHEEEEREAAVTGTANVLSLLALAVQADKAGCLLLANRAMENASRSVDKEKEKVARRQLDFLLIRAWLEQTRPRATSPPNAGPQREFWQCLDHPAKKCLSQLWPEFRSIDDTDLSGYAFLGSMLRYVDAQGDESAREEIMRYLADRLRSVREPKLRLRFLLAALTSLRPVATGSVQLQLRTVTGAFQKDELAQLSDLDTATAADALAALAPLPGSGSLGLALLNAVIPKSSNIPGRLGKAVWLSQVIDTVSSAGNGTFRRQGLDLITDRLLASRNAAAGIVPGLLIVEALTRAGRFKAAQSLLERVDISDAFERNATWASVEVARAFIAEKEAINMPNGFAMPLGAPLLLSGLWQPDGRIGPTLPFEANASRRP